MSFVGEVWVSVYNPWTGLMVAGAEVVITSPCEPMIIGVTNASGVFKTFMTPCPQVNFFVSKAGYRENYATLGVGGDLTEVDIALQPSSGEPPPLPPVVTDLGIHVSDQTTGSAIAGAQVTVGDATLITNWRGIVVFRELALAVYAFLIQMTGYHDQLGTVDTSQIIDLYVELVSVAEPPPPPLVEVSVKVRVRYTDGSRGVDIPVRFVNKMGGYDVVKTTNSTGYAYFNQVPVGKYRIYLLDGQWDITVIEGMGTVQLDIEKPAPPPTPPEEIPVEWDAPAAYKSGIYTWSIKFNIVPIPFLDQWLVQLVAGRQDDETRLNQIMASEGVTGTATIIKKNLTTHKNWLGVIDSFTIHYQVAFSGDIAPVGARAALFPWIALVPYIPAFLSILSLIIIGLIVNNITSTIKTVVGPQCYTPREPGICADGFIYDAATTLCCAEKEPVPWVPILVAGGILFILTQSK